MTAGQGRGRAGQGRTGGSWARVRVRIRVRDMGGGGVRGKQGEQGLDRRVGRYSTYSTCVP